MHEYRVELDAYSGPLDLLLYLVRRDEIDLYDVPIARLTEQYLAYLRQLQAVDVNLAGEFLVMAATLLEIKSQMLLPQAAAPGPGQEAPDQGSSALDSLDPRYELVQQLLAYKRFKDAATNLETRLRDWSNRFPCRPAARRGPEPAGQAPETDEFSTDAEGEESGPGQVELDLEDVHVLDLTEAFARILDSIGLGGVGHQVVYDDTPIGLHAEDIVDRLQREGPMTLDRIFEGRSRSEAIGLFLAMLELVRQGRLKVGQEEPNAPVGLELRSPPPAEAAADPAANARRWVDPVTGQVEYDWPSEEIRRRVERRAELRAKWAGKRQFAAGQTPAAGGEPADEVIDVDEEGPESSDEPVAGDEDGATR